MSPPRDRILAAARALFVEGGPEAVTMRAVAEKVGVTATALYRHFESKEALIQAVISAAFEKFGAYLYRALDAPTPAARMDRCGEAYLDFALENRELYRTIFMTPRPGRDPGEGEPGSRGATFQFLVDRVREGISAGLYAEADPEAVALAVWAHVHGLVSLQLAGVIGQSDQRFRETYRASLRRLFEGLNAVNGR